MKKQVAVLFGGRSSEHEISVITGLEIVAALDAEKYEAIPVYIDLRGRWFAGDALRDKSIYKSAPASLEDIPEVSLDVRPGKSCLQILDSSKSFSLFGKKDKAEIPIDVFYPAFHGQFGEDGCVQGLLEMAAVAYTGCDVRSSAIAMDKEVCKSLLKHYDIPSLPGIVVNKSEMRKDLPALRTKIKSGNGLESYPLFVKPVHLGSSIAVGKADNDSELDGALAAVFERDEQAIIEPCITNMMEINVSIMEGEDGPVASVVEIPVVSDGTLTYEDKYLRSGGGKKSGAKSSESQGMASLTRKIDPEDLDDSIKQAVINYALKAFDILGCAGIVRFDFMIDLDKGDGELYFNELNPLPGSLANYLWAKSSPNLLYSEMLDVAIEGSLRRFESKRSFKNDEGFRALA